MMAGTDIPQVAPCSWRSRAISAPSVESHRTEAPRVRIGMMTPWRKPVAWPRGRGHEDGVVASQAQGVGEGLLGGDHVVVREHHPLGGRLGAGGEQDRGDVVARRAPPVLAGQRSRVAHDILEAARPGSQGLVLGRSHEQDVAHRPRRGEELAGHGRVVGAAEPVGQDRHPRLALLDHVGPLGKARHGGQGDDRCPALGHRDEHR